MGSTNKTVNYDLPQFIGSDKPTWLVDVNGAFAAIDAQMKVNADAAATADAKAVTADGKADTVVSSVNALDAQINGQSGIAADLVTAQGNINTINSLIGNGEPTTTNKTLIGAINEINAKDGELTDLTTSAKTNLVAAINEVNASIPSAAAQEKQSGTLTAGTTSVVLTFAAQTIGAATLVDIYTDTYGVNPTAVATTSTTITLTFEAQASDVAVSVVVKN